MSSLHRACFRRVSVVDADTAEDAISQVVQLFGISAALRDKLTARVLHPRGDD
jgi:hypothetical protein